MVTRGALGRMLPEWPPLTPGSSAEKSALRAVQPVLPFTVDGVRDLAQRRTLVLWAWSQLGRRGSIPRLYEALRRALASLLPPTSKWGRTSAPLEMTILVLSVALAVSRISQALEQRFRPRWVCRVLRLLPPGALHLGDRDSEYGAWLKSLLLQEEIGPHKACVYVLFNHAGAYVGKADLMRQNSLTFATQGVASRLSEHLRSVLRPFSAQGQKPRYKLLRRSIGSIAFLPIQTYASPEQAFAAEALAIRMECPAGNELDARAAQQSSAAAGRPLTVRGPRRRPVLWQRRSPRARPWSSIWALPCTAAALASKSRPQSAFPGALGLQVPYGQLYRAQLQEQFAMTGEFGPLWIWERRRAGLLLSWLVLERDPWLPRWHRGELADRLYWLAGKAESLLAVPARRNLARRALSRCLWRLRLPPLSVPLLQPPAHCKRIRHRVRIGAVVHRALDHVRCAPARRWLQQHTRVAYARVPRWSDSICANRVCREFGTCTFHSSGGFAVVGHAGSTGRLETTYLAPQGAHHQGLDAGMDDMVQARSLTAEGLPSWLQQAHDHGHRPSSLSGNTTAVGAVSGSFAGGFRT